MAGRKKDPKNLLTPETMEDGDGAQPLNTDVLKPSKDKGTDGEGSLRSLQDTLGIGMAGNAQDDVLVTMMTGARHLNEYLPRSVLSLQELQRKRRIRANWSVWHFGGADTLALEEYDLQGRPAIGGLAREQVVKMYIGQQVQAKEKLTDRARRLMPIPQDGKDGTN